MAGVSCFASRAALSSLEARSADLAVVADPRPFADAVPAREDACQASNFIARWALRPCEHAGEKAAHASLS
jgi:hypothetical protein